ncbi:MAG: response regulator [Gammaproteobacteria bacterium]|nr:response regulator [Gammaproteobacteria bacterium]
MNEVVPARLPKTILYVEDVEANVKVIRAILKSQLAGCELLSVPTAEEGLVIALEQQPDVILMDINLPDMDGLEATRRLKQDPKTADIPVIALTADAMPQQIEKADNIGFSAYVTKPIDMTLFLQTLFSVYETSLEQ